MLPNRFFARDGLLMCTRHGAKFRPDDGACVHGPCPGTALSTLPIEVCTRDGVQTTAAALYGLCARGGSAIRRPSTEAVGDGGMLVLR